MEHSDWWRKMSDLPYSISKSRQGLRSVNERALVWEDGNSENRPNSSLGSATRCDEVGHLAAILMLLEASQTIADHRRCLLKDRSSVASLMGYFHVLLRCSSQRW